MLPGMHVPQSLVLKRNVGILKKLDDNNYKLIRLRTLRESGYEESAINNLKNSAGHKEKLSQSLSRTRTKIFELAICNEWEYFVTLTIDPKKHDSVNLELLIKVFSKWLNNYKYRKNVDVKYLLIPEPHKDGKWHLHGLMSGIPKEDLRLLTEKDHLPYKLLKKIKAGSILFSWKGYSSTFGWSTVEPIYKKEACAKYITKYITKDLSKTCVALNAHLYYCSKGLKRAEEIYRDILRNEFKPDFENDYVAIKRYENMLEALLNFCDVEDDVLYE